MPSEGLEYVRALYDGGVAEADRYVGVLLATLEEAGLSEETAVIVTRDHGEELGDRDRNNPGLHGHSVYDEVSSVPLIIYDPTRSYPPRRIDVQVRAIDTMHTVLDLLGVPGPEGSDGRSLLPVMLGEESADRPAFIRLHEHPKLSRRDMYSLREGMRKPIVIPSDPRRPGRPGVAFFDLEADPRERVEAGDREPERRAAMLSRLTRIRQELEAEGLPNFRPVPTAPESLQDKLRALGYLE
jgi:arylsulfatase A-like enzyme